MRIVYNIRGSGEIRPGNGDDVGVGACHGEARIARAAGDEEGGGGRGVREAEPTA